MFPSGFSDHASLELRIFKSVCSAQRNLAWSCATGHIADGSSLLGQVLTKKAPPINPKTNPQNKMDGDSANPSQE